VKAIWVSAPGAPEVLVERALPIPEPGPGEVRVRIAAAAFNPVDAAWRRGEHGAPLPGVLGRDFSGVVDALGEGVAGFRIGEAVLGYGGRASNGSYAECLCLPAELLGRVPPGLDLARAAALPVVGLTALRVRDAATGAKRCLVTGASGAVGRLVVQLAEAECVATTSSDTGEAQLRELGVPPAKIVRVDRIPRADWAEAVGALGEIDGAVDLVGGELKKLCFEVVAPGSRVVSVVEEPADFPVPVWDEVSSPLVTRSLGFQFVQLGAVLRHGPRSRWARYGADVEWLAREVGAGRVWNPVEIVGSLSAETAREAHRRIEKGTHRAKLVMTTT